MSCLHHAVRNSHVKVVKILLDHGAAVDSTTRVRIRPLRHSAPRMQHADCVCGCVFVCARRKDGHPFTTLPLMHNQRACIAWLPQVPAPASRTKSVFRIHGFFCRSCADLVFCCHRTDGHRSTTLRTEASRRVCTFYWPPAPTRCSWMRNASQHLTGRPKTGTAASLPLSRSTWMGHRRRGCVLCVVVWAWQHHTCDVAHARR